MAFSSRTFSFYLAGLAALGFAGLALAQDFSEEAIRKASPYKDLPGVQNPQQVKPSQDDAECSQEIELRSLSHRERRLQPDTAIIYRCERNGIVIESARPPLTRNWNPLDER